VASSASGRIGPNRLAWRGGGVASPKSPPNARPIPCARAGIRVPRGDAARPLEEGLESLPMARGFLAREPRGRPPSSPPLSRCWRGSSTCLGAQGLSMHSTSETALAAGAGGFHSARGDRWPRTVCAAVRAVKIQCRGRSPHHLRMGVWETVSSPSVRHELEPERAIRCVE
jgi:hypothetical protein